MRTIKALLVLTVAFCACSSAERYVYDRKTDDYVLVGKRQTLKAGRKQTISMMFSEQMGEVYGLLNGERILFKCLNPEQHQQVWTAEFDVPKFDLVGPEKFLRVYATDLGGDPIIGGRPARFPGAWTRRGEDGKFPDIPVERFERYEIRE